MSTRALFTDAAKSRFLDVTRQRYSAMVTRLAKRKIKVPFSLYALRVHLWETLGDYDGVFECKYCARRCDISQVELDHKTPLSRNGSAGLENIDTPCAQCNQAKGEATAEEFLKLMLFLEREIPLARIDILHRLSTYGKLVAGKRRAEMLVRNGGTLPPRKQQPGKPPLVAAAEQDF